MKKLHRLSLLAVGVLMVIPVMANAQSLGAVVIRDTSCTVLGPDLEELVDFPALKVITPSRNCNVNVSCHGDLPDGMIPPNNARVWDYDSTGWVCEVTFDGDMYYTTQWHETITPTGNVSLTCHFMRDCEPPEPPEPEALQ